MLPRANLAEASLVAGVDVVGAADLGEALAFLFEGRPAEDPPGRRQHESSEPEAHRRMVVEDLHRSA